MKQKYTHEVHQGCHSNTICDSQVGRRNNCTLCATVCSMEGLEFVGLHGRLVFVQVCEWVLCPVVVSIVVRIDGLCLQARDCVEFLDCGSTETSQSAENSTFNLCNLRVFNGIYKSVLGLGSVVLELLGSVLLTKGRNLIEVHLQIVCHLLGKLILWSPLFLLDECRPV